MSRNAADRSEELAAIHARRVLSRITADYTDTVARELDGHPFGPHTDATARVLRFLRSLPITGKDVLLALGDDGPWAIGVVTIGTPGNMVVHDEVFDAYEDAARTVLRRRRAQFVHTS